MADTIWKILEIPPSDDKRKIKATYFKKLKSCSPEDKPEEFKQLREAYERALDSAKFKSAFLQPQSSAPGRKQQEITTPKKTDNRQEQKSEEQTVTTPDTVYPFDGLEDDLDQVYRNFQERIDLDKWRQVFNKAEYQRLDLHQELSERCFRYFIVHNHLPQPILQWLGEKYHWNDLSKQYYSGVSQDQIHLLMDKTYLEVWNQDFNKVKLLHDETKREEYLQIRDRFFEKVLMNKYPSGDYSKLRGMLIGDSSVDRLWRRYQNRIKPRGPRNPKYVQNNKFSTTRVFVIILMVIGAFLRGFMACSNDTSVARATNPVTDFSINFSNDTWAAQNIFPIQPMAISREGIIRIEKMNNAQYEANIVALGYSFTGSEYASTAIIESTFILMEKDGRSFLQGTPDSKGIVPLIFGLQDKLSESSRDEKGVILGITNQEMQEFLVQDSFDALDEMAANYQYRENKYIFLFDIDENKLLKEILWQQSE
jgi:hypothetical protein